MANEQSISLRCLWVWQKSFLVLVPARAAATSATVTIAVESFRTIFQTRSVEEDPASVAVRAQIRNGRSSQRCTRLAIGRTGSAASFLIRPLSDRTSSETLSAHGQEVAVMTANARLVGRADAAGVRTVTTLRDVGQKRRVGTRRVDAGREVEDVVRAARKTTLKMTPKMR